jgi:hypothetical protein
MICYQRDVGEQVRNWMARLMFIHSIYRGFDFNRYTMLRNQIRVFAYRQNETARENIELALREYETDAEKKAEKEFEQHTINDNGDWRVEI